MWLRGWSQCSELTGRLVVSVLGVAAEWVRAHPFHTAVELVPGLHLTLLPANHCPGRCR